MNDLLELIDIVGTDSYQKKAVLKVLDEYNIEYIISSPFIHANLLYAEDQTDVNIFIRYVKPYELLTFFVDDANYDKSKNFSEILKSLKDTIKECLYYIY